MSMHRLRAYCIAEENTRNLSVMIYNSKYKIELKFLPKRCYNVLSPKWQALHELSTDFVSTLFMVAHYTFKYILKYAVNYLIMIDRIVDKKFDQIFNKTFKFPSCDVVF